MTPTELERRTCREIADWAVELGRDGDGPVFTAAIILNGTVIAREKNEVIETGDPTRHAEVVAIARAARAAGGRDLSGATLIASCQPCEMCLGAMRWAKISRLVFSARKDRIGNANFRFAGLEIEDFRQAANSDFDYAGGLFEDAVVHLYT